MKTIISFAVILSFCIIYGTSCKKDNIISNKLIGNWVEKYPEEFDGVSDTIIFMDDLSVKKHFYFNNWQYVILNDTLFLRQGMMTKKYLFSKKNSNEIIIYNFIDRSITTQVKDIQFIKKN